MASALKMKYGIPGLIPFVVAIIGFLSLLKAPHTGMTLVQDENGWMIRETAEGSPVALVPDLKGSHLVAIDSFVLEPFDLVEDFDYIPDRESLVHWWKAQRFFAENIRPDKDLTLTISTGSGEVSVVLRPDNMPFLHVLERAGMMFFLGLFSLLVGLSVIFRKPEDARARLFYYMVYSVAMIFVTFGSYTSREIAFNIAVFSIFRGFNIVAFVLFPVLFFHFCLVFPRQRAIAKNRLFMIALYSLPILVSILYQPRISYLSLSLLFVAGLIAGVVSVIQGYFTARSALEKYQIRWVLWGVFVFATVFLLTTFIPILFNGQRLFGDRVPSFFFIFIPLSMAFAITRYHLMDIETVFDTTIIYATTLVIIAVLDLGVMSLLTGLERFAVGIGEPSSSIIALWFAILAYIPVRNAINSGVKRLLKREVYDSHETALQYGTRLLSAHTIEEIAGTAASTLDGIFHPKGHGIGVFAGEFVTGGAPLVLGTASVEGIDFEKEAHLRENPTPFWAIDPSENATGLDTTGSVFVPLKASAGPVGYFFLKGRQSGKLYSSRDMKLLKMMAGQTAMALESMFRKVEGYRLEQEARKERERISREIHDGIGSSFSNSIMMLNMLEKEFEDYHCPASESGRIGRLKQTLAGGLSELRDLIWTIEEKDYRLGDLIPHLKEKCLVILGDTGIKSEFSVSVENDQLPLTAMIRLNIIRIVQESLANVVKHSGADEVAIVIENNARMVCIEICDNGHGFDTTIHNAKGYGLRNIKKRCEEMGGIYGVSSNKGKGTAVSIRFTVPETSRDREE